MGTDAQGFFDYNIPQAGGMRESSSAFYTSPEIGTCPREILMTTTTIPTQTNWGSVTFGNGLFVTVRQDGAAACYSPDGIRWFNANFSGASYARQIAYGNGMFIGADTFGAVVKSYDGISWFPATTPAGGAGHTACLFFKDKFIISDLGIPTQYSSDGIVWTNAPSGLTFRNWATNGSILVGMNGSAVNYTYDGLYWYSAPAAPAGFLTASNGQSAAYSDAANIFVAFCGVGVNTYMTSTNGITWTLRTLPITPANNTYIAYGGGMFLAITTGSNIAMTSADGINWVTHTLPITQTWVGVAYGNGIFVGMAQVATNILYSVPIDALALGFVH